MSRYFKRFVTSAMQGQSNSAENSFPGAYPIHYPAVCTTFVITRYPVGRNRVFK